MRAAKEDRAAEPAGQLGELSMNQNATIEAGYIPQRGPPLGKLVGRPWSEAAAP
jgi:hypothetical protein